MTTCKLGRARMGRARRATSAVVSVGALAIIAAAAPRVWAQDVPVGGIALSPLEPPPAGDAFFGVPSPFAGGHLVPRAYAMFDYAREPLRLLAPAEEAVVSSQAYMRLDASLALFDRLVLSLDFPFAVAQSGSDPGVAGVDFHPPSSAEVSDLRLGARGQLFGDARGPFAGAIGAYLFLPTGPSGSYAGEGAVRVQPHAVLGGRVGKSVGVAWSANVGTLLRTSENPSALTFGCGVAGLFADGAVQIGPEIYGSAPLGEKKALSTDSVEVATESDLNLELAFGAKVRFARGIVVGAAGGPGLSRAIGTPSFRAMALLGWAPEADAQVGASRAGAVGDKDEDGFNDDIDACPNVAGDLQGDPKKDGCPKPDRDNDAVPDLDDACPMVAGVFSSDPTKNGCPQDKDGDGVHDGADACPTAKGAANADPKRNGCPDDRDGDGIPDALDACDDTKGPESSDPKQNGCPDDPDGDGLKYSADACPRERGQPTADPTTSGCPKYVRVTDSEIVLLKPVRFKTDGRTRLDTIDPISDDVLREVAEVIQQHPEIETIEVQGHTDDDGTPEYNDKLSVVRANNVKGWLVKAGVPAAMLITKGYGSSVPLGDNRIRAGRLKNRRVQFIILKKKAQ